MSTARRRQLRAEADRAARAGARAKVPAPEAVPRGEVVLSQPAADYAPPAYLSKTATPAQVEELAGLLRGLRAANEEHAGEATLEAQAYLTATGEGRGLEEGLRAWCEGYFRARADRRHLGPHVGNDPFQLAVKLEGELGDLLGELSCRPGTLNCYFLNLSLGYVPHLLYELLWRDLLWPELVGGDWTYGLARGYRPHRPGTLEGMARRAERGGWLDDHLGRLLRRLAEGADGRSVAELAALGDAELLGGLAAMASDVQQMRPLLAVNFKPRKAALDFGPGLSAAWSWALGPGIAGPVVGDGPGDLERLLAEGRTRLLVAVDHGGLLCDARMPWVTAATVRLPGGPRPLALNYHLLERFHERLLSFYGRIDLRRARAEVLAAGGVGPEEGAVLAALAASCRALADSDPEGEEGPAAEGGPRLGRLRPLRSGRLLALLDREFGCQVERGKGSEVTLYRHGGRKFRLGHHRRSVEVHPLLLRRLLGRLGIAPADWLRACHG